MDFLINYYVAIIMKYNLPYAIAFFVWHSVELVIIMILLCFIIGLFTILGNKIFLSDNNVAMQNSELKLSNIIKSINSDFYLKNNQIAFTISLSIAFAPIILLWCVLPLATNLQAIKSDFGILLFLTMIFVPFIGILMLTYNSKRKNQLFNLINSISFQLPIFISALVIVIILGSFNFYSVIENQYAEGIFSIYSFSEIIAFLIFIISFIAQINIYKLDFPLENIDKNEKYVPLIIKIVGYCLIFTMCMFCTILFLGGFIPPIPVFISNLFAHNDFLYGCVLTLEQLFWLFFKTYFLIFMLFKVQKIFPQIQKYTQPIIVWKYLIPVAVVNLIITAYIKQGGIL